jgi:hypothetical protein
MTFPAAGQGTQGVYHDIIVVGGSAGGLPANRRAAAEPRA